jgi:hypothetical protein
MSQPEENPYSDSHLDSPEYRKRLLRKLNTLIAVLEVACAKVKKSLQGPDPDIERLTRIQNNLRETLQVCQRAKNALERCEEFSSQRPAEVEPTPLEIPQAEPVNSNVRSDSERRRFERLGPIDLREVRACDVEALCRRLLGEAG